MRASFLALCFLACTGEPASVPTPAPTPIPTPVPTPIETGPVTLTMSVANLSSYDLIYYSMIFCAGADCETLIEGDGTTVIFAAGTSVSVSQDLGELVYGEILSVAVSALDNEAYGYCWEACEYVDYTIGPTVNIAIEFTDDDCCWEF